MSHPPVARRAVALAVLLVTMLVPAACSRPTPSAGQATEAPRGMESYPGGTPPSMMEQPSGPKEGEPGYPPPKTATPDPYPGKTETAAAGGAVETTPTATATP